MTAFAVIPARGGSQGVRRKNLRVVGGVPLVVRTIRAAHDAESVGRVVVSTDDPEIASVSRRAGAEVVDRPLHLAGPGVPVHAVVADAIAQLGGELGRVGDGPVVVLQPTSPFTDGPLIDAVVEALDSGPGFDSMETVTGHRHALYRADAEPLHREVVNRQHADVVAWRPTGAVKVTRRFPAEGGPLEGEPLVSGRHGLFDPEEEMTLHGDWAERYALDVDTPADFAVARDLASRGKVTFLVTAGADTGSGHLHRCLTLADELAHHDIGFDFMGEQAEWAVEVIRDRGYRLRHALAGHGDGRAPDLLVLDCLEGGLGDLRRLTLAAQSAGTRVVVLECLDSAVVQAADLAVNSLYTGPAPALCGPHWEPLRPEFAVCRPEGDRPTDDRVRVLVTFGGTDPSHLTERFAEVVRTVGSPVTDLRVLWPPGRDRPPPPNLTPPSGDWAMAESTQAWPLPLWEGSVSDALAWADIAVTSGGRTVLEAAAMSCPAVVVAAHEREEHHAPLPGMMWLGHHAQVTDAQVRGAVDWLARNPEERQARGARARAAVDPAGATVRLADMIDRLVRG